MRSRRPRILNAKGQEVVLPSQSKELADNEQLLASVMEVAAEALKHVKPALDALPINHKELVVGTVLYGAALARMTQLPLKDFLYISGYAYENVEISRDKDQEAAGHPAAQEPESLPSLSDGVAPDAERPTGPDGGEGDQRS